jgi:hypothetical protein
MYWNVTAARLAFIVVFEHVIFFIIYVMQWLVPDVPKSVQDKIAHERSIDQKERWASKSKASPLDQAHPAVQALMKMEKQPSAEPKGNTIIKSPMKVSGTTSRKRRNVNVRRVVVH